MTAPTLSRARASFVRQLRAERKSDRTIESYTAAIDSLARFLGDDPPVTRITRDRVEGWLLALREQTDPPLTAGGIRHRFNQVRPFLNWLVREEEIPASPLAKMKPPKAAVDPPDVLDDEAMKRLLATCATKLFDDRRDNAMIRLLAETGMRRAELTALTVDGLDLDDGTATVIVKGGSTHTYYFTENTAHALDRYLRVRNQRQGSHLPNLWLGKRGPMTASGIADTIALRSRQAGLGRINPHRFRHSAAHSWLAAGGSETGLMAAMHWTDRTMLSRYGASAASQRAKDEAKRMARGNRY